MPSSSIRAIFTSSGHEILTSMNMFPCTSDNLFRGIPDLKIGKFNAGLPEPEPPFLAEAGAVFLGPAPSPTPPSTPTPTPL